MSDDVSTTIKSEIFFKKIPLIVNQKNKDEKSMSKLSLEEKLIEIVTINHPQNSILLFEIKKIINNIFIAGVINLNSNQVDKNYFAKIMALIYYLMNDEEFPLLLEFFNEIKKEVHDNLIRIRNNSGIKKHLSKDFIKLFERLAKKDEKVFEILFTFLIKEKMFMITKKIIHFFSFSLEKINSMKIYEMIINSNNYIFLNLLLKKKRKEIFKKIEKKIEKKILIDIFKNYFSCKEISNHHIFDLNYGLILEECINEKLEEICKLTFKFVEDFEVSENLFFLALEKDFLVLIKAYLKRCKNSSKFPSDFLSKRVFLRFLDCFDNKFTFIDSIYIFYQLRDIEMENYYQRLFCEKFLIILNSNELKLFFGLSINPILCCILISHYFLISSRIFPDLKLKMIFLAEKYRDFALEIIKKVDEIMILKNILEKVCYPSKLSLLDILFSEKDFFISFLVTETLNDLIRSKWNCSYTHDYNLCISSTSINYLKSNFKLQRSNIFILFKNLYF